MEDFQIIELYFARDEAAIQEPGNKYGKLCFQIAHNILFNIEDSEECVNDTYLGAWNTIPPKKPNNFMAFLCKITRNLSLKRLDYNMARKRTPELLSSFDELESVLSDSQIEEKICNEDISVAISKFLKTESAENRNVFIRKYWFCDSIKTISATYGFREEKVKSMLHRTRNRLKDFLKKEGIAL